MQATQFQTLATEEDEDEAEDEDAPLLLPPPRSPLLSPRQPPLLLPLLFCGLFLCLPVVAGFLALLIVARRPALLHEYR